MKISRTKKTKAYIPKTEEEKEQVRIKEFLDMCAPSVLKFYPDYYICGSSFRSTWVVREYPTDTEEQALLRHLGDRSGVTLRVYTRHVTPAEERKIISNAASRNRMNRSSGNIQKEIIAESNLNDVMNLIAQMHRDREPLVHCAVFIEISTPTLEKLKEMQAEVEAELTRSKISVDKLFLRQKEGFESTQPCGNNAFHEQFERVIPATSAANLYPFNYSGKADPQGFYIGHDKYGSNLFIDFQRRTDDKTNANVLASDLIDILIMPTSSGRTSSSFTHEEEKASPGYYQVMLKDENINAELTTTQRTGIHRYQYPAGKEAEILLDLDHSANKGSWGRRIINSQIRILNDHAVEGYRIITGWAKLRKIYFYMEFSSPILSSTLRDGGRVHDNTAVINGTNLHGCFRFGKLDGKPLDCKVALSSVSMENARLNMQQEAPHWDFDRYVAAALGFFVPTEQFRQLTFGQRILFLHSACKIFHAQGIGQSHNQNSIRL